MKRILLVNTNTLTAPYPVPPLGLCLVARALAGRYDAPIYDGTFVGGEGLSRALSEAQPDYLGLSIRNLDDLMLPAPTLFLDGIARAFVEPLRALCHAPIILGGSGFGLVPGPVLSALGADFGIRGAGEETLPRLLEALDHGASPEEAATIPGVIARLPDGRVALGPPPLYAASPEAGDVDLRLGFDPYRARGSYPIQARRGCAHRCLYCTYPVLEGPRFLLRDPVDIVDELERASDRLGAVTFELVDATFNTPRAHAEAVCETLIRRGLSLRLRTMGVNPRGADEALLALMRRAGFAQIDITPDSASPWMLRRLRKGFDAEELRRTARAIRALDLPTMWFFLLGGPGEEEATLAETLAFIDAEVAPHDLAYLGAGLRIYPGTPLHRLALDEGQVAPDDDLLQPRFYVSRSFSADSLIARVEEACASRPNCLPAWRTRPDEDLLRHALALRAEQGLDEPLFRTLLRLHRMPLEAP